jgi:hypothetical protein
MTSTIDFTESVPTYHDPRRGRRRTLRALVALAVVVPLAVSVVYGVNQHQHATEVTAQRDHARSVLHLTRGTLHDTQGQLLKAHEDYAASRSDLSAAEDQLDTCKDVSKATMQLFNSTDSLLHALQNYPDNLSEIDSAGRNIDRVTALVQDNGFDTIQDFLDACKGTGTTGGTTL